MGRTAALELLRADAAEVEAARRRHAASQLSCLAGSRDKQQLRLHCGAVVGFRVAAGVVVAAGDPLVAPELQRRAVDEFVAICRTARLPVCFMQTHPSLRPAYRAAGLRVYAFGEEAVVDLESFCPSSPRRANLRHELSRARRAGMSASVLRADDVDGATWEELRGVSDAWLARRPWRELGFSVGRFGEILDADATVSVVRGADGRAQAFTTWLRLGGHGIALDMFRRSPVAPAGAMDLCIAAALDAARARGLRVASLGVAPFRDSTHDGDAPDGRLARSLRHWLFRHGTFGYDYRSLARFKDKFAPRWEMRDVAVSRGLGSIAVPAALALVHFRPQDGDVGAPAPN
ncbi:MAG TPA: DUF2156 domain-containing protein [Candidatus Dormibacteraeota bacterium]|nr:DUF2156 domain-containing protein [Candidatus Dormibacteraeota bacterium]